MIKKYLLYTPSVAIPPGDTLQEILDERGITQTELARRLNRPLKTINEIIKGRTIITSETSLQLEQVLDIPASFWNNLESNYQEIKARLKMEKELLEKVKFAEHYPYSEMSKLNWVPVTSDPLERVKNLLKYFGVTSFENIVEKRQFAAVFRISQKRRYSFPAISAWLRKGVIESENIPTEKFNKEELNNSISQIKALIIEDPKIFMEEISKILAKCGVAFVVTSNLPNAPINGSTRWITPDKALIQMSIRNKYSDIFWFSLFHEIGHTLFDNKRDFNVDFKTNNINEKLEEKSNKFAANTLIPLQPYLELKNFIKIRGHSGVYRLIEKFAKKHNIHPGIVVGRLQHDDIIPRTFNKLRDKFKWVENR